MPRIQVRGVALGGIGWNVFALFLIELDKVGAALSITDWAQFEDSSLR
jgi:hypothetical protein